MKRIPTFVSDDNGSIIHIIKKNNKKLRKEDFLKDLNISRSTFFRYQKIYEKLTEAQKENIIQQVGD